MSDEEHMADARSADLGEFRIGGPVAARDIVRVTFDGRDLAAIDGEPVAATLLAHGLRAFRTMPESASPRGLFCGVGRCVDCLLTIDGEPNARACVTPVRDGMTIESQRGLGEWKARG